MCEIQYILVDNSQIINPNTISFVQNDSQQKNESLTTINWTHEQDLEKIHNKYDSRISDKEERGAFKKIINYITSKHFLEIKLPI